MKVSKLTKLIAKQSTESSIQDLIEGLLTPKEFAEIEKRINIIEHLKAGLPQHEIARKLSVGVATVTRGSLELQRGRFTQIAPNRKTWRSFPSH